MSFATRVSFALLVLAILGASAARAEEATGDWGGLLVGRLHVIFHIEKSADGRYVGATESPDQTDAVTPASAIAATPGHLHIEVEALHATYDADWDAAGARWVGALAQAGLSRLTLRRLDADALRAMRRPARPQEAAITAAPASYVEQEVRIANPAAPGVTLAGTFVKPQGAGPFACVVLIAGSGRLGRDEAVSGHRPLMVLADALARRGVASLRYDKRGVDASTGDYQRATTADLTSDAQAAVAWVRDLAEVDPRRVGVAGHSEGGAIAPAVAASDPGVGFVVMLAGPGLRGDRLLLLQERLIAEAAGAPVDQIARRFALNRRLFDVVLAARDEAEVKARIPPLVAPAVADKTLPVGAAESIASQLSEPWLFHFLRYDPVPTLRRLRVPVVAIAGSLDLQVPPEANLNLIKAALQDDPQATVIELPGLNHALQHARTGSPDEYASIEETIAPFALKVVTDWVVEHAQ